MRKKKEETPLELIKRAFPDCSNILAIGELKGGVVKVITVGESHSDLLYTAFHENDDVSRAYIICELRMMDENIWSTGEIPQPFGHSVLYFKDDIERPWIAEQAEPGAEWYFRSTNPKHLHSAEEHREQCEEWYIELVNLPRTSGTGE